jgi:magnesium-transporting ATPase (P-type)
MYGISLSSRENNLVRISVHGQTRTFEVLHVLEFNSYRKRMSVIVKDLATDMVTLYCKGADSVILERLTPKTSEVCFLFTGLSFFVNNCVQILKQATVKHLNDFATSGLRTLLFASKVLDPVAYRAWSEQYYHVIIKPVSVTLITYYYFCRQA